MKTENGGARSYKEQQQQQHQEEDQEDQQDSRRQRGGALFAVKRRKATKALRVKLFYNKKVYPKRGGVFKYYVCSICL